MTLTPREYLHQHFGPKDRKWIESLSDERCFEVLEDFYTLANGRRYNIDRKAMIADAYWANTDPSREKTLTALMEELHPLPDAPRRFEADVDDTLAWMAKHTPDLLNEELHPLTEHDNSALRAVGRAVLDKAEQIQAGEFYNWR